MDSLKLKLAGLDLIDWFLLLVGLVVAATAVFFIATVNYTSGVPFHFVDLAQSFLRGHLYLSHGATPWRNDVAWFQGQPYWALGPFPATLLVPGLLLFNMVGRVFRQGYLQLFFLVVMIYYLFKLARFEKLNYLDSFYIILALVVGSSLLYVAIFPSSYYVAHVVTLGLTFASVYEFLTKKRYQLIGFLMGGVLATRATAGLGIIFFIIDIWFSRQLNKHQKVRQLIELLVPFVMIGLLLGLYNYARFGNWLEQGYSFQSSVDPAVFATRLHGLFSFVHIPANLYYLFLAGPLPVPSRLSLQILRFPYLVPNLWGMSIFITSPYLLRMFYFKYQDVRSKLLWVTIIVVALPILLYYGIGLEQFGYRYALDFTPWLLWLFIREYKKIRLEFSRGIRSLIVLGTVFNLYMFVALSVVLLSGASPRL